MRKSWLRIASQLTLLENQSINKASVGCSVDAPLFFVLFVLFVPLWFQA